MEEHYIIKSVLFQGLACRSYKGVWILFIYFKLHLTADLNIFWPNGPLSEEGQRVLGKCFTPNPLEI